MDQKLTKEQAAQAMKAARLLKVAELCKKVADKWTTFPPMGGGFGPNLVPA
jgi:hypothetical protein